MPFEGFVHLQSLFNGSAETGDDPLDLLGVDHAEGIAVVLSGCEFAKAVCGRLQDGREFLFRELFRPHATLVYRFVSDGFQLMLD